MAVKELSVASNCGLSAALRAIAACSGAEKKNAVTIAEGSICLLDKEAPKSFETAARDLARLTGSERLLFPEGNAECAKWIQAAEACHFNLGADVAQIKTLSEHLLFRTFVAEKARMTAADVALYVAVHRWMQEASAEALQQLVPLVRWFDHMQHLDGLSGVLPIVNAIEKFESKKGEKKGDKGGKAAAEAKPAKPAKQAQPAEPARPLDDPTRLELRVGLITDVWPHPDADGLYCEKIDIGEAEPRQIASGLRKYIPIEQMKGARVVVFANLKQKALRGFPSHGMVLCAKNADGSVVEFVNPPETAKPGDLITFEGLEGQFEEVLSAKKNADALPAILPGLRSDDKCVALYKDHRMVVNGNPCTCRSVVNGSLS